MAAKVVRNQDQVQVIDPYKVPRVSLGLFDLL